MVFWCLRKILLYLQFASGDYKVGNASTLAYSVVKFEKSLAAASPDAEDQNDPTQTYNPISLKDAELLIPQVRLSKIISSLAPSSVEVNRLIVSSPDYIKALSSIISQTSREVLQTYFLVCQHLSLSFRWL